MSIFDSKLWIADLDETLAVLPELEELIGKDILITGCSGLICSAVTDVLIRWNVTHEGKIGILVAERDEVRVKERFSLFYDCDWFRFIPYDASSANNNFDFSCDYIIHGASNASPNKIIKEPVETMMSNFIGMKCLLDYAKTHSTKRVLYISTSEVYGKKDHDRPSKIDEYGGIDILNPRSSYSVGKCAAETLCASYYDEYNVDFVIVRPGHIYGPTASSFDNRVSSAWAYDAAGGKDIVMKSDGSQIRSYCYCLDCASAILKVLLRGKSAHAYNISNPNSVISIREMAEILADVADIDLRIESPTDKDKKGFNPMRNSSLDGKELLGLGWRGLFDASKGFSHTIDILKSFDGGSKGDNK